MFGTRHGRGAGFLGVATAVALAFGGCGGGGSGDTRPAVDGEVEFTATTSVSLHAAAVTWAGPPAALHLAEGTFRLDQAGYFWVGEVTTLVVEGNRAVAGGVLTDSNLPEYIGTGFYQIVLDVDDSGTADMSESQFLLTPDAPPAWVGPIPTPGFTITSGDYVVKP